MKKPEQIGAELAEKIQGDVHIDIFNRVAFSTDASIYQILPQCVAAPKDEQDVVRVVEYARDNGLPIAPRGAGSGVAGESLTAGIVLDIRRHMDQVIDLGEEADLVTVQPGIVLDELNERLRPYGRMIGPDPSSANRAVVGGCLANNATGAHSLQYGYFADHVERVRGVLADGSVVELLNDLRPMDGDSRQEIRLARECIELLSANRELIRKAQPATQRNRSGYNIAAVVHDGQIDLARLMAGSEGTLAVFTEITLRTVPIPPCRGLVQFEFDSFGAMARAVLRITEAGASACELMDQRLMTMARQAHPRYADILPAGCKATLMAEFTGPDEGSVRDQILAVRRAVGDLATGVLDVLDEKQQQRLWKSRKDAVPLLNREKGPAHPIPFIEDVSVDPAHLAEYIAGLERIGTDYGIDMAYYGHAGDGELHIRPYIDLSQPEGIARMKAVAEDVFRLAWSLGGSISGEHADGLVRAAFIQKQYGQEYYKVLKAIKYLFDPAGILNPGKILNDDPQVMERNLRTPGGDPAGDSSALLLDPREFRFEAEQCSGCGSCLSQAQGSRMCPVFRGMNEELFTSRAKANLLRVWSNMPEDVPSFDQHALRRVLSLCVNCKMCSIQCPAGVDVSKMIIEARARLARETGFSVTETALSHNRHLSQAASLFAPVSNWVLRMPVTRLIMEKTLGLDRRRHFPGFQRGSLVRRGRRYLEGVPAVPNPADKVVYFVDSYANWNDHELGMAVIRLLRALDVEIAVPHQRPAPLPAYVYGNLKTARRDLDFSCRHLFSYVRKGYKVVCSEPSAALCLRDEMKYLLDSEESRCVAKHTVELMDYLGGLERQGRFKRWSGSGHPGGRIAYHSPCHRQALGPAESTVDLFARLGIQVTDLNGGCCGLAGTAGMQHKNHRMTEAIGSLLAKRICELEPDLILTECAACAMQIEHLTNIPVLHPVKFIWNHVINEEV